MTANTAKTPPKPGWEILEDTGFIGHVGPIWQFEIEGQAPRIGFVADDHHKNLNGVVQGGMMMTLADRGMGRAARRASGTPVATISFTYDFVDAARIGRFIEVHPEVTRLTGSMIFMQSQLFDDETLIGRASGVWKRLKPRT